MEPLKPQLMMELTDLSGLPPVLLDEGYTVKCYQSGYSKAWEQIILESFRERISFNQAMAADPDYLPERVLFMCNEGQPIATASAWFRGQYGDQAGYLHMVGLLPSFAGKGLGLQISLAALHQMKLEGRTYAVLETDDFRLPALKSYFRIGFQPKLIHENQIKRWADIRALLGIIK